MYQGYKLKQNGYRIPAEAHLQKNMILNKKSAKVKIPESIRGEKGVQENLPFTQMILLNIENKNKEVLEHQLVTTS